MVMSIYVLNLREHVYNNYTLIMYVDLSEKSELWKLFFRLQK